LNTRDYRTGCYVTHRLEARGQGRIVGASHARDSYLVRWDDWRESVTTHCRMALMPVRRKA